MSEVWDGVQSQMVDVNHVFLCSPFSKSVKYARVRSVFVRKGYAAQDIRSHT